MYSGLLKKYILNAIQTDNKHICFLQMNRLLDRLQMPIRPQLFQLKNFF